MKIKRMIVSFLQISVLLLLCGGCLYFSKELFSGVSNGISICLNTLIPSMFFFMVLSCFLSSSGIGGQLSLPFKKIARGMFRLDTELFSIFILSIIGGYPIGAKLLANKIKQNEISVQTAEYMLNFCVYCSPAFLFSGVSYALWGNLSVGVILYFSQVLSGIIIAVFTSRKQAFHHVNKSSTAKPNYSVLLVDSVKQASSSMGMICSFVVLFCGLFSLISQLPISVNLQGIIKGVLEVTSGCQMVGGFSFRPMVLLCAFFTSFGGICVHIQLFALLSDTSIRFLNFIKVRLIYTVLSVFFTAIGLLFLNPATPCIGLENKISYQFYSVSPISSLLLLCMGIMLLLFYHSSGKIKKETCSHCSYLNQKVKGI